ncbi:MAG: hypothetical protein PHN88_02280 [Ignavibacteria bacterium]|nr:hypothetical protein [Ignavibacteria bacterium]
METIIGNLKRVNSNLICNDVSCEFKYDEYGGISEGKLFNINIYHNDISNYCIFKNETISLYIYIKRIVVGNQFIAYFDTIRLKRLLDVPEYENCLVFVTDTDLFFWQEFSVESEKYKLASYQGISGIGILNSTLIEHNRVDNIRNTVDTILLYIQLVQLHYCKVFGCKYKNVLYLNYQSIDKNSFTYRRSKKITSNSIENFVSKFRVSTIQKRIDLILHRLVYANQAHTVEVCYTWIVFILEGIVSLINNRFDYNPKKFLNEILDEYVSDVDILKVYYEKGEGTYWKPLLSVYRNRHVHFIENKESLKGKPKSGQGYLLDYVFKDDHDILFEEFDKYIFIVQKLICVLLDINYDDEKEFLKIYEDMYKREKLV